MKEKLKEAVSIAAMAAFFTFVLFYVIFYLTPENLDFIINWAAVNENPLR